MLAPSCGGGPSCRPHRAAHSGRRASLAKLELANALLILHRGGKREGPIEIDVGPETQGPRWHAVGLRQWAPRGQTATQRPLERLTQRDTALPCDLSQLRGKVRTEP